MTWVTNILALVFGVITVLFILTDHDVAVIAVFAVMIYGSLIIGLQWKILQTVDRSSDIDQAQTTPDVQRERETNGHALVRNRDCDVLRDHCHGSSSNWR